MPAHQPDTGNNLHSISVTPEQNLPSLVNAIRDSAVRQRSSVLIILPESPVQAFRRPEDFLTLKHLKRELGLNFFFVISAGSSLHKWAERYGFSTYISREEFLDARARNPSSAPSLLKKSSSKRFS